MPVDRQTVLARRALAKTVADAFLPLEQSADQTATHALRCTAALLEARRLAALDVTEGEQILALLNRASNLAFEAQAAVRQVHAELMPLADKLQIEAATPECPGLIRVAPQPLRSVA